MVRLPVFGLLAAVLALSGCKDGLLEPERLGTISGQVLDFETGQPLAGAGVTTSPATGAIVTDADGAFVIGDALVGSYTITASRTGYKPNTVTVAVREGGTTPAALFLRPEDGDDEDPDVVFGAEVLNFTNEVFRAANGSDSTYVTVEYRALNNGDVDVDRYEIYFRIDTDRGPFYQEIQGTDLPAGQRDLGSFRKYLVGARATAVVIEDTAAEQGAGT